MVLPHWTPGRSPLLGDPNLLHVTFFSHFICFLSGLKRRKKSLKWTPLNKTETCFDHMQNDLRLLMAYKDGQYEGSPKVETNHVATCWQHAGEVKFHFSQRFFPSLSVIMLMLGGRELGTPDRSYPRCFSCPSARWEEVETCCPSLFMARLLITIQEVHYMF